MQENSDVNIDEAIENEKNVIIEDSVPKVRGSFDASVKRKKQVKDRKVYYIAIGLVLALFGAIALILSIAASRMGNHDKVDETLVKADPALARKVDKDDSYQKFRQKKATEIEPQTPPIVAEQNETISIDSQSSKRPETISTPAPTAPPEPDSGLFAQIQRFDTNGYSAGTGADNSTVSNNSVTSPGVATVGSPDSGNSEMSLGNNNRGSLNNLSGTDFSPSKAYVMPNRKYLVAHNTYTRCALYTEVITDQPGLIDCRLTEPLYSADGSIVIAEAGDKLTGEQKVEVKAGQTRVFTTWKELETTAGVRVQINSLGAGPMGASGTEAWINNHYKERFGGAVLLSFFQDTTASVSNALSRNSNSGLTFNNSESNVQSMAEKALDNSINIPPTAYVLPGTVMTVIVARDIDFSSVFTTQR